MRPYYYSLNEYINETYGHKLYKLALDGGMTCPNRDGTLDTRGCIFCSAGGSGDFTGKSVLINNSSIFNTPDLSDSSVKETINNVNINNQIEAAKALISSKYDGKYGYIAYFQSYTNTYADIHYLENLFMSVCMRDDIQILSIATRPDCLNNEILNLLKRLNSIKPVWVELGLQTIHEKTAEFIRRGYPLSVFDKAVKALFDIGIKTIVHMIIGLPGESEQMILETADYIGHSNVFGIKLQLLHILKNTDLADFYYNNNFEMLDLNSYTKYLAKIIELLPADMVIHRLTGDGPKKLLIAPQWSADKKRVMNTINKHFKDNNIYQGRNFK